MNAPETVSETVSALLKSWGQLHLQAGFETAYPQQQRNFLEQLQQVDWPLISGMFQEWKAKSGSFPSESSPLRAELQPLPSESMIRRPRGDAELSRWSRASALGEQLLARGKVAALVVAGGQGTRLGFDHPKGMYPIGPVSGASLFQGFCEQLVAQGRKSGATIPYCIMTSDATHSETMAFFEEHRYFNLHRDDLFFFQQQNMPALDAETGRLLLARPCELALSPNGHGGMLSGLRSSGILDELERRGVEHLYYHQVDNPAAIVCDPAFLGWHVDCDSGVSTKVVAKASAAEKMGVAVSRNGRTEIVEYSDLPPELAAATHEDGSLKFWAGNTAIHVFRLSVLRELSSPGRELPFHLAKKIVPHFDPQTQTMVIPTSPNAIKFERFIFDVLPAVQRAIVVEGDRQREFHPVKNATGADSPESSRQAMQSLYRMWLRSAGVSIADNVPIEISPLKALGAEDLKGKFPPGTAFSAATVLR